jgi:hypothetical protein
MSARGRDQDLFESELDLTLERIASDPKLGIVYEQTDIDEPAYRVLMSPSPSPPTKRRPIWELHARAVRVDDGDVAEPVGTAVRHPFANGSYASHVELVDVNATVSF